MYFILLSDLADEALEGKLANEQLGGLLVPPDLAQRDGARAEAVRLLHASEQGALASTLRKSSNSWGRSERGGCGRGAYQEVGGLAFDGVLYPRWSFTASFSANLVLRIWCRGCLPPVDLRADCFVRAMVDLE